MFQIGHPCGQHLSDANGKFEDLIEALVVDIADIEGNVQLRTDFTVRSSCNCQKLSKIGIGMAFKTFRDVRRNGDGGPPDLVSKPEILGKGSVA